jgi:hypothetical protein
MEDMMLNKQQLDFRKAMAEKEKQQVKSGRRDIYSYRYDRFESEKPRKITSYKKPFLQIGGMVGLLVLLWNVYALSTWVMPQNTKSLSLPGDTLATTQSEDDIHNYILRTSEIDLKMNDDINTLMNHYNQNVLTISKVDEIVQHLYLLQAQTATLDSRLQPLKSYYDGQFKIVHQMVDNFTKQKSQTTHEELTRLTLNLNQSASQRQLKMIMVFQAENIEYELNNDGTVSYEYTK